MKLLEKSHNHVWLYALFVFGLLSRLLLPSSALAADQGYGSFWYGPSAKSVEGVSYIKTGVVASNKYDAALYALGFGETTVTGVSNTTKNKLIKNSTFSSYADGFKTGKPDDDLTTILPGIPTVGLNTDSMLSAWYAANAVYGTSNCFWSIYSEDSADAAHDAAYTIIKSGSSSGGGSGSGGGGGSSGDAPDLGTDGWYSVVLEATNEPYSSPNTTVSVYDNPTSITVDSDGKGSVSGGSTGESIKWDNTEYIYAYIDPYSYNILTTQGLDILNCIRSFGSTYCYISDSDGYEFYTLEQDSNYGVKNTSDIEINFKTYDSSNSRVYRIDGKICVFFTNIKYYRTFALQPGKTNSSPLKPFWTSMNADVDPPIDWPDPTPNPDPPEPPDPIEPDPPLPWNPIPGIDVDITGEDFQDLLDALNEHCIHLQTSIQSNISQLWQLQSALLTNQFQVLGQNLHNDLMYLAECLNVDVNVNVDDNGNTTFDDSSVVYWLKQIWSKLGDGINIEPTDPVTNNDDWWAWLLALMSNFVGMLLGFGSDKLSAVGDALGALTSKFPFSLPWDLAALLALLDAPPQIPEWDIPCFAVSLEGLQQVGTYHITLEDYDSVWENVRWIERLSFIVLLIRSSDFFTGLMRRAVGRD